MRFCSRASSQPWKTTAALCASASASEPSRGAQAQRLPPARGAVHSADIEYFMGNLATNMVYAWTDADERLSELMQQYYANFVTNGDPNGRGVPQWPPANAGDSVQLICLDIESAIEPDRHRARYLFLDEIIGDTLAR